LVQFWKKVVQRRKKISRQWIVISIKITNLLIVHNLEKVMKVKMSPEDGLPTEILSDGEESPTEEDPKNPLRCSLKLF
jgi:hypothetical protein